MSITRGILVVAACLLSLQGHAVDTDQVSIQQETNAAISALEFYTEPGVYPLAQGRQSFDLPTDWSLYLQAQANELLTLMRGFEATTKINAVVVEESGQFMIFNFIESGYVKDYDWQYLDPDMAFEGIVENYAKVNQDLIEKNQPTFTIIRWAFEPTYLKSEQAAFWAVEAKVGEQNLLIGNVIKLGKAGYTLVEWTGVPTPEYSINDNPLLTALSALKFDQGFTYEDYTSGDQIADKGIAELLAGGGKASDQIGLAYATSSLAYRLWIIVIAVLLTLFARMLLIRRLNKTMMSESKKAKSFVIQEDPVNEVPAASELRVVDIDVNTENPVAGPHKSSKLKQARSAINLVFAVNLLIGAVYLFFYYLVLNDKAAIAAYMAPLNPQITSIIIHLDLYKHLALALLIWNTMRFVGERNQLGGYGLGLFGFLKPFTSFIFNFFNSTWFNAIGLGLLIYTFVLWLVLYLPEFDRWLMVAAMAIHLLLWGVLKVIGRKRINTKLLILRVFLIGKTSAFTFKGLAKSWKHFGSYFTVADPSFYKVTWKQRFNVIFPLYILILFLLYTAVVDPNREIEQDLFIGFAFMLLIGNLIFIINSRIRMKQKFMSTSAVLDKRLKKLARSPTILDNTFKPEPVMCFDNTWKLAVDGLIDTADVVLMDLRGFSEANKGCAYEVNVLFDSKLASNIVFIGYQDAGPMIKDLIKQQWAMLSADSPNLNIDAPYTTLYTVKKEGSREIQSITNALLESIKSPMPAKSNSV